MGIDSMNGLLLARLGEDTMRDVDCQSLPLTRRHNTTLASRRRQEPGARQAPGGLLFHGNKAANVGDIDDDADAAGS